MHPVDGRLDEPTLDEILQNADVIGPLPHLMPVTHLKEARYVDGFQLDSIPLRHCDIFNEQMLYLFYGGIFYRKGSSPTRNATWFPVAFVLDPAAFESCSCFYPFDTGAANAQKYGTAELGDFLRRFRVSHSPPHGTPANIVYHFYGTNAAYLSDQPRPGASQLAEPCPTLYQYLNRDHTAQNGDQRCTKIEVHMNKPLSLKHLVWLGYPNYLEPDVLVLKERLNLTALQCCPYPAFPATCPSEYCLYLQQMAYRAIFKSFATDAGAPE